jgi:vacuolar-type H+-ATPase subunit C/Vma6
LSQTTRYANVLVKIGAGRSEFLSESKFRGLTETNNLADLISSLRESSYQQEVAKVAPPLSSRKLERAFNENLIGTYIKIIMNSPKKTAEFLKHYLIRFEVENIKTIIKAVNAELHLEQKQAKIYFAPENYFNNLAIIEEALRASSINQVVSTLKKTKYSSALKMGFKSYEENTSTTCFDVLLDKYYYEELWAAFQSLPKKEKPHAYPYVSFQVDSYVLLMLLRSKLLNYDSNWLRIALPTRRFRLSDKTTEDIVSSADFESALKIVLKTSYAKYFDKTQSSQETISLAENAFEKAILKQAKETRFKEIFNVGAVLAFLTKKSFEVRNLTTVSLGVEYGKKPEDIERQLLF